MSVVYLDQQAGALHAVGWSKLFFSVLKQLFQSFSIKNGNTVKKFVNTKKMILTSKWLMKHPFASQNIQQMSQRH